MLRGMMVAALAAVPAADDVYNNLPAVCARGVHWFPAVSP